MTQPDSATALEEAAAHWAVRVDAGTLTAEEEAELEAWTRADPRRAGAFARAMAANAYFDRVAALGVRDMPPPERARTYPLTRRAWLGGAAGALAASLIAAVGWEWWSRGERIEAGRGTIRRASLQDGSAVTLNTNAEIEVALQQQVRNVRMLAGEVNFDVAKDAARPFVVEAGPVRIRVVGTSFLVRLLDADSVAVTVREGIVDVERDGGAAMRLTAGDRTVLHPGKQPERLHLSPSDVDRLGLWQSGQIDLTGMTLGDAAAEFARYSDQHIVIDDPVVARMKVAGVYSVSDPAGFASAAAESMDLTVSPSPDAIWLSRKP
jgi:transmembrane sensor